MPGRTPAEFKQGPRQHGSRGFVPRNQHGHQVVAEDHAVDVFAAHIHQKSEQRRVVRVVALFQLLHGGFPSRRDGAIDQISENVVEHGHVFAEFDLSTHPLIGVRQVPVGNKGGGAVLGFTQDAINSFDNG